MPRRMRDSSNIPSTFLPRERSLPKKEPSSRNCAPALPPPLRSGEPAVGLFPTDDPADGWTWSSPTGLLLQLLRVIPDPQVRKMRASSETSGGRARPFKRFCPPPTRSPHSGLPHPLDGFGVQKESINISLCRVIGDTPSSLLQRTGPTPAPFQSSASLSIIRNKDANGFALWWRTSLHPDLLDTPTQVCIPHHYIPLPLSHLFHEWERLPGVSLWVLRTIRSGYTLQFGRNPPRFDGVHLTVVSSASKASVLHQEISTLLLKGEIEEVPQSDLIQGFFSRYFLVPKKDSGLWPILNLHRLNISLYKGTFKMLTLKTIMSQIQVADWFVSVNLKDA